MFPPKYFYLKISCIDKIRFPFLWCLFKNLRTYRLALTGRKVKADMTKNNFFFLFFRKKDIKTLFELCKLSRNFQLLKQRFSPPVLEHHIEIHRAGVWSPPSNPSVCNFWLRVPIWEQLGNLFWRHFLFILAEKIQALEQKPFTAKFHIRLDFKTKTLTKISKNSKKKFFKKFLFRLEKHS